MIIAHHLIWTGYGWWLPNDPRGGASRVIRSDVIAQLGDLHHGRKRIQPASADIRRFYQAAETRLRYPLLSFAPAEIETIAEGINRSVLAGRYTCYACAVMPDHVHLLLRKHRHRAEEMIARTQKASADALHCAQACSNDHPVWANGGWKVFLDHPEEVRRTIRYVRDNPIKMGMPRQEWAFVREYDGWPLHAGHSPNSPYARRRRGEPFRRNS